MSAHPPRTQNVIFCAHQNHSHKCSRNNCHKIVCVHRPSPTAYKVKAVVNGIKLTRKAVGKGVKGICVMAANVAPLDVISHMVCPVSCCAVLRRCWTPTRCVSVQHPSCGMYILVWMDMSGLCVGQWEEAVMASGRGLSSPT